MPSTAELQNLLADEPQETLSAEYKSWLDLGDTRGRATLAKAAIALANRRDTRQSLDNLGGDRNLKRHTHFVPKIMIMEGGDLTAFFGPLVT